jgi:hypothetical protein
VSILGKSGYHDHIDLGFLKGVSSRTSPADTILFNFRARSSSKSCPRVFPSFRTTLSRESGCTRIPILPRPLVSNRLSIFGPLVTQASAVQRNVSQLEKNAKKKRRNRIPVPMTIFLASMPFNVACDLATTSMFRIRLPARFSLNVICKMAESMGFPEICRPSLLSFLCEILKFAVEYLCCTKVRYCSNDRNRGEGFLYAYMITLSWYARRWRRVLLLRLFIFRGNSIKDALTCFLSFGSFRRINFTIRPLLSQARTHSSANPLEWIRAKRRTTTKTRLSASIQSGETNNERGGPALLTVYVIQTTAGAMSKKDVARRQSGPVQKLALLVSRPMI